MTDEEHGRSRGLSPAAVGLLAVLGGALSWVAWLSWPISGNTYHPAQVVACALTCAVIAVILAGRSTRAALVTVPLGDRVNPFCRKPVSSAWLNASDCLGATNRIEV